MKKNMIVCFITLLIGFVFSSNSFTKQLVKTEILVGDNYNKPISYYHSGNWYVEAGMGERYIIRLTNISFNRVVAVVAVDGRNVITGKKATLKYSSGYVLEPNQSVDITGFRKSLSSVATFRFASPYNSYAMKMADRFEKRKAFSKLGTIGIAVFTEKETKIYRPDYDKGIPFEEYEGYSYDNDTSYYKSEPEQPKSSEQAVLSRDKRVGTKYGEDRYDKVTYCYDFEPAYSYPDTIQVIYYNTREGLRSWGIPIYKPLPPNYVDSPYWDGDFAPPPPNK